MSHSLVTSNKRLDFGADADHDTDPLINGVLPLKDRGCSALAYIQSLGLPTLDLGIPGRPPLPSRPVPPLPPFPLPSLLPVPCGHRRRSRGDRGIGPPLSGLGDNPPLSAVI